MQLESWLSAQPDYRGTPLLVCAASLTIALEAHALEAGGAFQVSVGLSHLVMHNHQLLMNVIDVICILLQTMARDVSNLYKVSAKHLSHCTNVAKSKLVDASKVS